MLQARVSPDYLLPVTLCPCSPWAAIGLENSSSRTLPSNFLSEWWRGVFFLSTALQMALYVHADWRIWTASGSEVVCAQAENRTRSVWEHQRKSVASQSTLLTHLKWGHIAYPWKSPDLTSQLTLPFHTASKSPCQMMLAVHRCKFPVIRRLPESSIWACWKSLKFTACIMLATPGIA